MKARTVVVVITAFNNGEILLACLESFRWQTLQPDRLTVADDGSKPNVREQVMSWAATAGIPVNYTWQPDKGFRAARSRNLGVMKSLEDIIIFVDGDCIAPPNFVRGHLELLRSTDMIACGGRKLHKGSPPGVFKHCSGDSLTIHALFKHWKFNDIPLGVLRKFVFASWKDCRTCNLSMWKKLFRACGGFDESFTSWGYEDSDLVLRLLRSGGVVVSARLKACVLHFEHIKADRSRIVGSRELLNATLNDPEVTDSRKSIFAYLD